MTDPKHAVVRDGAKFIGVVPADAQLVAFAGRVFAVSPNHPPMQVTPDGTGGKTIAAGTLVTTF